MPPQFMGPLTGIGTELLYSFIIVAISLIVYFSTREIEKLSSYKGIIYFRKAFLFFALAFFFKVSIQFLLRLLGIGRAAEFAPSSIGFFSFLLFILFSILAMFNLIYSLIWKKVNLKNDSILYIISIIITLIILLSNNILIYLAVNILMLSSMVFIIYFSGKKSKKNALYPIYILLLIFLVINIIDILLPNFLQVYQLLLYFLSSGVFLAILYKVLRRLGA